MSGIKVPDISQSGSLPRPPEKQKAAGKANQGDRQEIPEKAKIQETQKSAAVKNQAGAGNSDSAGKSGLQQKAAPGGPNPAKTYGLSSQNQNLRAGSLGPQGLLDKTEAPIFSTPQAQGSGEQAQIARDVFMNTAAALGFPKDTLSIALLAFARFFSLSPALLGSLRRESLASLKSSSPESPKGKAALEAKALAAAAAMDKGVVLSPEALERYAEFFMSPAAALSGEGSSRDREEVPTAEELKAVAAEPARKDAQYDDLLGFMNVLPGRNGQKWLVCPFSVTVRGTELRVFLRLLKKERLSHGDHLIADIAGPKRQWRFFLRKTAGKLRADISVYPGLSERGLKHLSKEAGRFLDFEEIIIGNGEEFPFWADDLCNEPLPYVNEAV